jgi:glucose-1-phosphate cytidylyltransferase
MQVAILCGGMGSRMKEKSEDLPKPLAMIGNKPIIWHIMKIYSYFGFNEFILMLGYKGDYFKEYFMNYEWKNNDFILNTRGSSIKLLSEAEEWKITFVDTGLNTMTGCRIKKIENYITEDTFMLTYGDGLSDININKLLEFHREKGKTATVTGILKQTQFGILTVDNDISTSFQEKSSMEGLINGGFFVLNKDVFKYISEDENCIFEQEPLKKLAIIRDMAVYQHKGFWKCIDTYKDLMEANKLYEDNEALWRKV